MPVRLYLFAGIILALTLLTPAPDSILSGHRESGRQFHAAEPVTENPSVVSTMSQLKTDRISCIG